MGCWAASWVAGWVLGGAQQGGPRAEVTHRREGLSMGKAAWRGGGHPTCGQVSSQNATWRCTRYGEDAQHRLQVQKQLLNHHLNKVTQDGQIKQRIGEVCMWCRLLDSF